MADNKTDWKSLEIGALWEKEVNGVRSLYGNIKNAKGDKVYVVVFSNKFHKEGESSPQWRIYKSPPKTTQVPSTKPKVKAAPAPVADVDPADAF